MEHNLIYGLKDEQLVHISNVESGKNCGCICPACKKPLVAKKGTKRTHHFAHHDGKTCEYGYETSLHLAAKDIISKEKKFIIPPADLKFPNTYKIENYIPQAKRISIDKVELETRYGGIVPDIVIYSKNQVLFVEIFVTHQINDEKLEKIKMAGFSTIEIDLSQIDRTISKEELTKILLNGSEKIKWKYNRYGEELFKRFYSVSEEKDILVSKEDGRLYVNNCPLKVNCFENTFYRENCKNCEYLISADEDTNKIRCTGKERIATKEDFKIPYDERIRISNERIEKKKKQEQREKKSKEKRRALRAAIREEKKAYRETTKCPNCEKPLNFIKDHWKCSSCGSIYNIYNSDND